MTKHIKYPEEIKQQAIQRALERCLRCLNCGEKMKVKSTYVENGVIERQLKCENCGRTAKDAVEIIEVFL